MSNDWRSVEDMDPIMLDPMIRQMTTGKIKLDIGSGGPDAERRDRSWTTVDRYMPADLATDMGDLPFKDATVDEIFSAHALEHVARARVMPILAEWFRVLKSGGTVTLLVPDFDFIAQVWLEGSKSLAWNKPIAEGGHCGRDVLGWVFGSQAHEGEFHKTAWNLKGLQADLEDTGFRVESIESKYIAEYTQNTIWAEAIKP